MLNVWRLNAEIQEHNLNANLFANSDYRFKSLTEWFWYRGDKKFSKDKLIMVPN